MRGYSLEQLRTKLQATRGETRVKVKEEPVRNEFIQTAVDEVLGEYDWYWNRVTVDGVEADAEGVRLPKDFSAANDWYFVNENGLKQDATTVRVEFSPRNERFRAHGLQGSVFTLTYYRASPDLLNDSSSKVYFPLPMLLVDRAYVRLKIAYFPDEDAEKELLENRRALTRLFVRTQRSGDLTHQSWR